MAHGYLYSSRPHPEHLTNFYITISVGGLIGGVFVSVISPNIFSGLYEYPLLVFCTGIAHFILNYASIKDNWQNITRVLVVGIRFSTFAILFLTLGISIKNTLDRETIFKHRNFYGIYTIDEISKSDTSDSLRTLHHGNTLHGGQFTSGPSKHMPIYYYYEGGNIQKVFSIVASPRRIAIIGLGTGSLAAYGRVDDSITFFEIDPDNEFIANSWFTYLKDSKADIKVYTGDGRITLQSGGSELTNYDLILIDAFTGDGIPTHLLTREALQVYLSRLDNRGIILFHISNRYYDLAPIIKATASELNLHSVEIFGRLKPKFEWAINADCVALSREKDTLEPLVKSGWSDIVMPQNLSVQPWSDDYINLLTPIIIESSSDSRHH